MNSTNSSVDKTMDEQEHKQLDISNKSDEQSERYVSNKDKPLLSMKQIQLEYETNLNQIQLVLNNMNKLNSGFNNHINAANSTLLTANNIAKQMRNDLQMSETEIFEYCSTLNPQLIELGEKLKRIHTEKVGYLKQIKDLQQMNQQQCDTIKFQSNKLESMKERVETIYEQQNDLKAAQIAIKNDMIAISRDEKLYQIINKGEECYQNILRSQQEKEEHLTQKLIQTEKQLLECNTKLNHSQTENHKLKASIHQLKRTGQEYAILYHFQVDWNNTMEGVFNRTKVDRDLNQAECYELKKQVKQWKKQVKQLKKQNLAWGGGGAIDLLQNHDDWEKSSIATYNTIDAIDEINSRKLNESYDDESSEDEEDNRILVNDDDDDNRSVVTDIAPHSMDFKTRKNEFKAVWKQVHHISQEKEIEIVDEQAFFDQETDSEHTANSTCAVKIEKFHHKAVEPYLKQLAPKHKAYQKNDQTSNSNNSARLNNFTTDRTQKPNQKLQHAALTIPPLEKVLNNNHNAATEAKSNSINKASQAASTNLNTKRIQPNNKRMRGQVPQDVIFEQPRAQEDVFVFDPTFSANRLRTQKTNQLQSRSNYGYNNNTFSSPNNVLSNSNYFPPAAPSYPFNPQQRFSLPRSQQSQTRIQQQPSIYDEVYQPANVHNNPYTLSPQQRTTTRPLLRPSTNVLSTQYLPNSLTENTTGPILNPFRSTHQHNSSTNTAPQPNSILTTANAIIARSSGAVQQQSQPQAHNLLYINTGTVAMTTSALNASNAINTNNSGNSTALSADNTNVSQKRKYDSVVG